MKKETEKAYLEKAYFYHKPTSHVRTNMGMTFPERKAEPEMDFVVEKVIVLSDEQFARYVTKDINEEVEFLFDNRKSMWFNPATLTWHCLLIKGDTGKEGLLVESEGYSYARYVAPIKDCSRLRLKDVPVSYSYREQAKSPIKGIPGR